MAADSQKQYWEIKQKYRDVILFFKVGTFYELYEDDAQVGHDVLGWKMTITGVGHCRQVQQTESLADVASGNIGMALQLLFQVHQQQLLACMQVGCPEGRIDENVATLTAAGYKVLLSLSQCCCLYWLRV